MGGTKMVYTSLKMLRSSFSINKYVKIDSGNNVIKIKKSPYSGCCLFNISGELIVSNEITWGVDFEICTDSYNAGIYILVLEGLFGMDSFKVDIKKVNIPELVHA